MKKVTETTVRAFLENREVRVGNTEVILEDGYGSLYLFGNKIAENHDDYVLVSDAGWQTATTKERLNGIMELINADKIVQRKRVWYRNGEVFAPQKVMKGELA